MTQYEPSFRQTPPLRANLDQIERDAWLLGNMVLMPRYGEWFRREVTVERARSTTRIEGIGEEGADQTEAARSEAAAANANAVRAYEFVDYVSDLTAQPIDELVLRQINREFLHGVPAILTPGIYRRGQNSVGAYKLPNQGDVPALMQDFVGWLQHGEEHAVLAAGIAHLHFVAIHPFWDGNGRTARALEALVLQRSPFHFKKLLSMEKRLLGVRAQYFAAIERTLGERFVKYDATPWLEFYTTTLAAESHDLVERIAGWHQSMEHLYEVARNAGLQERHAEALAFLLRTGTFTRADYIEITGVSPVTASRDLRQLVEKGLVVGEGRTAARVYRPSESIRIGS